MLLTSITVTVGNAFNTLLNRTGDNNAVDGDIIIENYQRFDLSLMMYLEQFDGMEMINIQGVELAEVWEVYP